MVSAEGTGKARRAGAGLANFNNFSGFWGVGAVPSCLVPGPGVVRAGGQWPSV